MVNIQYRTFFSNCNFFYETLIRNVKNSFSKEHVKIRADFQVTANLNYVLYCYSHPVEISETVTTERPHGQRNEFCDST